jgi:glycosyltransferase involved in cell wall biosynthesis
MKILVLKDRNVLNTKFVAQFVHDLAELGHNVHLVCDSFRKAGSGVDLDPRVKFTNLSGKTGNLIQNLYRYCRSEIVFASSAFRRLIKKNQPDVIIAYFPKDLYNATHRQVGGIPTIQMFHCYPPLMIENLRKKSKRKSRAYLKCTQEASALQVLNESYVDALAGCIEARQIVSIPNAIVQIPPAERTDLAIEKKRIIYIARLDRKGKRQHILVEAFAAASTNIPGWSLEFWGLDKGSPYKQELLEQAASLGVGDQVRFMGYHPRIQEVYRCADIHAFPSSNEGFSLALSDGMAMGLPGLGFQDCPFVNEIIKDGSNGFLAKDNVDFAGQLERLMRDQPLRIRLGEQAARDMEPYAPEKVASQWDGLIRETVHDFRNG